MIPARKSSFYLSLLVFLVVTGVAFGAPAPTPQPAPPQVSAAKANPAPAPQVAPAPAKHQHSAHKSTTRKWVHNNNPSRRSAGETTVKTGSQSNQVAFDEAKNLLVSDQKYVIRFEDEEAFGRLAARNVNTTSYVFSEEDIAQWKTSVGVIADYRNQVRTQCSSLSNRSLTTALDRYLTGLGAFNRRALPIVADITENNSQLILIVNRSLLIDAPILVSRYLQFKKQRFKENMSRFLSADRELVGAMTTVAKILKVELTDDDWNKTYGIREAALESMSLWPRDSIFEATDKLSEARENACVVQFKPAKTEAKSETPATGD